MSADPSLAAALAESSLPHRSGDQPLFRVAWHARVFSLIVQLVKDGRLPWTAFQERLASRLAETELPASCLSGDEIDRDYFDCWLEAAHDTLVAGGFISNDEIAEQIESIHNTVDQIRADQLSRGSDSGPIAVDERRT